jgi:hypothetical protein
MPLQSLNPFADRRLTLPQRSFCFCYNELKMMQNIEDPIVLAVIERMKERSAVGIAKYGTTLAREDLSTIEWLNHLQEELMDAINYIERLKLLMGKDDRFQD